MPTAILGKADMKTALSNLAACFFITGSLAAQQAYKGDDYLYLHGTCITVAWREQNLAVVADSRQVQFDGATLGDEIGDVCKLRQPTSEMLVSIDGLGKIIDNHSKVIWDGLAVAEGLFKGMTQHPSRAELLEKASRWQDSFQFLIDNGVAKPTRLGNDFVTLEIFTRVDTRAVVLISRFATEDGRIIRKAPFFAGPPAPNETKIIPFGSCTDYIGTHPTSEMTQTEMHRYHELRVGRTQAAHSVEELRDLSFDLVEFASQVAARLATPEKPAEIAPPFSGAILGVTGWIDYPSSICANYLH